MIEQIESFKPKIQGQALIDGEDARDLCINVIGWDAAERVSTDIAQCAQLRAGGGDNVGIARATRRYLGERRRIQVFTVGGAADVSERHALVHRNSGHKVWTVESVVVGE